MIITSPYNFISNIRTRSVLEFGAKGDGTFEDTAAFQAAANSGEPVIYIPRTTSSYVITDEILLPSNITFLHDVNAKLIRKSGTLQPGEVSFYRNSDYVNGNSNIHIIGGYFDCNGANNTRVDQNGYGGGVGFRFKGLINGSFRDVTIKDPNCFSFQSGNTTNLLIENITFEQPYGGTNQDGIHINGPASRTTIRNVGGTTRDDMVAILANERTQFNMGGLAGVVWGTVIDGVWGNSGTEAVRIVSAGNSVTNIKISNISGAFPGAMIRISDEDLGTAIVYDIQISDCSAVSQPSSLAHIHFACAVRNCVISNCTRNITSGGETTEPFLRLESGNIYENIKLVNIVDRSGLSTTGFIRNDGTTSKLSLVSCDAFKSGGAASGSFILNTGTIDWIGVSNCSSNNLVNFILNSSGTIKRASVSNNDIESATNFFAITGTAATKTKLRTSGNQLTSVTNTLNLNSQPVAMSGIDLPIDRTVLTPDSGDIVNDSTDGIKRYNGNAWV